MERSDRENAQRDAMYEAAMNAKERQQFYEIQSLRDFIEWLFEVSEHCDHITQSEAWDEYDKYLEK